MYRESDAVSVATAKGDARTMCPACGLTCRVDVRRCGCGYDLSREFETPEVLFDRGMRRSEIVHAAIGIVFLALGLAYATASIDCIGRKRPPSPRSCPPPSVRARRVGRVHGVGRSFDDRVDRATGACPAELPSRARAARV